MIISDKGIQGLVIKVNNKKAVVEGKKIECGAGVELAKIVILAKENNLTGLEWAIGIPGTAGGAVRGNAGAYGHSIGELAETAEIFFIDKNGKGAFRKMSRQDCEFNYRESVFKRGDFQGLIWQIVLKLKNGKSDEIKHLFDEYLKRRRQTQPKLSSAGCIFKNVSFADLSECNADLADKAKGEGAVKDGMVGAGWIIDFLGLKGKTIGGAQISLEHANFIVNARKASAEDVITLISFIKQQARDKLKVQLREEIQYLGF